MDERDELLTMDEAARLMGVGRSTAYRLKDEGSLRVVQPRGLKRKLRVRRSEVERWLREEWVAAN